MKSFVHYLFEQQGYREGFPEGWLAQGHPGCRWQKGEGLQGERLPWENPTGNCRKPNRWLGTRQCPHKQRERDREKERTMVMAGVIDGAAEDGRGEIMPDQICSEPPENLSPVAFSWGREDPWSS